MRKYFISVIIVFMALLSPLSVGAATAKKTITLPKDLTGRILLQKESYNRPWYINPVDKKRYLIKNGRGATGLFGLVGLGITDKDLKKIPTIKGQRADAKLVARLKGRILLQVQSAGEAWYVNPADGLRYRLGDWIDVSKLITDFGLPVDNLTIARFAMNTNQLVPDTVFNDVAHVEYQDGNFTDKYHADAILPLASLTKLMTALVLLDLKPNWDQTVTISSAVIHYPKEYVGDDATSEVDLRVGDIMTMHELWVAMLVASSNQSTAALVDASGLSRAEFIAQMNEKAKTLGLKKTVFYDVAGLDADNVSTPKEMALIAAEAFNQDEIAHTSVMTDFTIATTNASGAARSINVKNRNYSLLAFNVDGAKTGYLVEARSNAAIKKNGVIIVVLHANGVKQRNAVIEKLLAR